MDVYQAEDYRQFMHAVLQPETKRVWGTMKRLAEALGCHSTYVSQILGGKADLSTEQALAFCRCFKLDAGASDHFIDLVGRDKAGNQETRQYFQERVERRLADRLNIKRRLGIGESLSQEQQARYYRSWLPQAVHMSCQLPGSHSARSIGASLGVREQAVARVLEDLTEIGLVEKTAVGFQSLKDLVHLGRESSLIGHFHVGWRMKTAADLMANIDTNGTHYSSVLTMTKETAKALNELILRHIEETRALVIPSPSEQIYAYCLDFFPLAAGAGDQNHE